MVKDKNTDEAVIAKEQHTEVSAPEAEQNPAEGTTTSGIPSEKITTDEEVLKKLEETATSHDEAKPSRKQRTVEKEAKKLESVINEDGIDYEKLSELSTDTEIGKQALEVFAKKQGVTVEELESEMKETQSYTRYDSLKEELDDLKAFKEEQVSKKETQDFLDYYSKKVSSYDITPAEFDSLYGEQYLSVFKKYVSTLGKKEASEIAFDMTIGKDRDYQSKIEEVKKKFRIKSNAMSPKPTVGEETVSKKLKTMEEVNRLPSAERIAYKKLHYDHKTRRVQYDS